MWLKLSNITLTINQVIFTKTKSASVGFESRTPSSTVAIALLRSYRAKKYCILNSYNNDYSTLASKNSHLSQVLNAQSMLSVVLINADTTELIL